MFHNLPLTTPNAFKLRFARLIAIPAKVSLWIPELAAFTRRSLDWQAFNIRNILNPRFPFHVTFLSRPRRP